MLHIRFILFCLSVFNIFSASLQSSDDENSINEKLPLHLIDEVEVVNPENLTKNCWPNFNVRKHYTILDNIDKKYAKVREKYVAAVDINHLDSEMLAMMLKSGGVAERTSYQYGGNRDQIPAGINLGGYCMMRVPQNVLFFHRMKVRNDTNFKILYLNNDLENMLLRARLALNDLHLVGSFDRAVTDKDPSKLFYVPTYGQAEFILKNVKYSMEGRYRLLHNTLNIVHVISELKMDDILMVYHANASKPTARLEKRNIDALVDRIKSDLNCWIKDYFNDYLMYFGLTGKNMNAQFAKYDTKKAIALNDFTDNAIDVIIRKLHAIKAGSVKLPKFTIYAYNGMQLVLRDGVLRGLDSMYRRSLATGVKEKDIRKVDALIAFSNLKVTYGYMAVLATGIPPLTGTLTLAADELVARLSLAMTRDAESVDLKFDFVQQAKPESLTVEGPANRMISHFNFLLERHIIAIMSNTLIHNIKMLSTISRCVPILAPFNDPDELVSKESLETNDKEEKPNNVPNKNRESDEAMNNTDSNEKDGEKKNLTADYVLWKKDSVELEFPAEEGSEKKKKMFLKYNENFALGKINN